MKVEIEKELRDWWNKVDFENKFPDKKDVNSINYYEDLSMRAVFSDRNKILDVEDIAENNIRIINKQEAEWLIVVLQKYLNFLNSKICECGHKINEHIMGIYGCIHSKKDRGKFRQAKISSVSDWDCDCKKFTPKKKEISEGKNENN